MKRSLLTLLLLGLSALVVVGRFLVPGRTVFDPALSYEAVAHVFVGGLLGAWLADENKGRGRLCLWLALALTAFEAAMFLLGKYGGAG